MQDLFLIGKRIGCLPGERKHRVGNVWARLAYGRNFEAQLTHMIVNQMCHNFETGDVPLQECYLVNPTDVKNLPVPMTRATVARLSCGHVHRGDLVWLHDELLAEVLCFFSDASTSIVVLFSLFRSIGNHEWSRSENEVIRSAASIVTAVSWVKKRAGVVWVLPPVRL